MLYFCYNLLGFLLLFLVTRCLGVHRTFSLDPFLYTILRSPSQRHSLIREATPSLLNIAIILPLRQTFAVTISLSHSLSLDFSLSLTLSFFSDHARLYARACLHHNDIMRIIIIHHFLLILI